MQSNVRFSSAAQCAHLPPRMASSWSLRRQFHAIFLACLAITTGSVLRLTMPKICPPSTPTGKHNPSKPLPAPNVQAGGSTTGKAGNQNNPNPGPVFNYPGKLTVAQGATTTLIAHGTTHQ